MADESLLGALLKALEHDPDSVPIRLQVGQLLLGAGRPAEAMPHFALILDRDPANPVALSGAADSARELGQTALSEGYARLAAALAATDEASTESAIASGSPSLAADEATWWEAMVPGVRLADVGGMEAVKERLEVSFFGPLRNPAVQKAFGASLRGGLLLYGPPGCGKTFLARAVAGELGASFIPVGMADVFDMWFGESQRKLHELFEGARRRRPSVLFFDEIDAMGQKRSQLRHHAPQRSVVNQLLTELDGVQTDNEGIYVMGATNHPWDVDSALLRPGRFDRVAFVAPPDKAARVAILGYHLREKPVGQVDLDKVAAKTDGFSGADLALLTGAAVESAMAESVKSGRIQAVSDSHLLSALRELKPSTRPWFETVRNFALFGNDGGLYDDLLNYMRASRLL